MNFVYCGRVIFPSIAFRCYNNHYVSFYYSFSHCQDVAEYIHEQGGIDLLLGAACRTDQPRFTEICLGIIGNLICSQEICLNSFKTAEQT